MALCVLSSVQNPQVKAVVRLHQAKYREAQRQILIEGRHPVTQALQAGVPLDTLYVREGMPLPETDSYEPVVVSEDVMRRMATTDSPPSLLAVACRPEVTLETLFKQLRPFWLGLVGLQDPGNLGTLIRTARAFGVTGVCCLENSVDPYHPKVIRSTTGLIFRLPVLRVPTLSACLETLSAKPGLTLWGADAHQGDPFYEVSFGETPMIFLGNEGQGLPADLWATARPVRIPMAGDVESLNVSVAGALLMEACFRKRSSVN